MNDDVASTSDLETVHTDGTVTSHADGIRRPYHEHVALARPASASPPAPASAAPAGAGSAVWPYHTGSPRPRAPRAPWGRIVGVSWCVGFAAGLFGRWVHL